MRKNITILSFFFFAASVFAQKPSGTLPVELIYFNGAYDANWIYLAWGTATEHSNAGFRIERRDTLNPWMPIGEFIPGAGDSASPKNYGLIDSTLTGMDFYHYRIKQVDNSGAFEYVDSLRVDVKYFSGTVITNGVILRWRTASEINCAGFEIEKRAESASWNSLGVIIASAGDTLIAADYEYRDTTTGPSPAFYYRLKQLFTDQEFIYWDSIFVTASTVKNDLVISPERIHLYQNYPNPFNPSTVISYQLNSAGNVTLALFDVLGREIASLIDEYQNAGLHHFELNSDSYSLSSGVYFYVLTSGDVIKSKKLILLR